MEAALKSTEYKKYINAVAELEKVEILSIRQHEKVAFFLNIYQCMYIHNFLKKIFEEGPLNEESSTENGGISSGFGFLGSIKQYVFAYSPKPFYYNIGGIQFNLEEIKHGLLRANVKAPQNYRPSLSSNDFRLNILNGYKDPRILFVCEDYPNIPKHMDSFDGSSEDKLDKDLDEFVSLLVNHKVNIDLDQGEITLPKIVEAYFNDFGGTEE